MGKAVQAILSETWAITEPALQTMLDIANRETSLDAVEAQRGVKLNHDRAMTIRDGVAVIPIHGPMFRYANLFTRISGATSVEEVALDLKDALNRTDVKAILLDIDSPGGDVNGVHELAEMIYGARGQKPIKAYTGYQCCSAAYWCASAADEVIADDTAVVGSIGVVAAVPKRSESTYTIEFVSSKSKNKRIDPTTESGRTQIQARVDALADVFIEAVARNRGITADLVVENYGAGGVAVGQQAVAAGLADRLGSFEQVLMELSTGGKKEYRDQPAKRRKGPMAAGQGVDMSKKGFWAWMSGEEPLAPPAAEQPAANTSVTWGTLSSASDGVVFGSTVITASLQEELSNARLKLSALEAENTALREQNTTQAQQIAAYETAVKAEQEKTAALALEARRTRFAELSKDWYGDKAGHIAHLEAMADTFGEESALFQGYVQHERSVAEITKTSDLFKEIGSDREPEATNAYARFEVNARRIAEDEQVTFEQAMVRAAERDPGLYQEYINEQRRGV